MRINRLNLFLLVLCVLTALTPAFFGCAGPPVPASTTGQVAQASVQSPKMIAYKTVEMAFDAYDLGMTTLRMLQKNKIITEARFQEIKSKFGWPAYNSIKASDDALQTWVKATTDDNYNKMEAAFKTMASAQQGFTKLVTSINKGGK